MPAGATPSGEEAAGSGRGINMHGMVSRVETGGQAGDWRLKTREGGRVIHALHSLVMRCNALHCPRLLCIALGIMCRSQLLCNHPSITDYTN